MEVAAVAHGVLAPRGAAARFTSAAGEGLVPSMAVRGGVPSRHWGGQGDMTGGQAAAGADTNEGQVG